MKRVGWPRAAVCRTAAALMCLGAFPRLPAVSAAIEARAAETAADTRAGSPDCPAAAPRQVALPATRAALAAGRPLTIVAFGSSSTEGAGASAPDRTYPARLAAFLRARWPGAAVTIVNRGMGGQTIEAMVARLERDVLSLKPVLVIWQAGANDALRGADPAWFGALLDTGVRQIAAAGGDLILMDNQIAPRLPPTPASAVYGSLLARAAAIPAVSLFSRTALMREWGATGKPLSLMIGADGLHHTDLGYACLAESLGQAIANATTPVPGGRGEGR